ALLTFNEIIANGFDAHHFITGLASHYRDLLVCKDEETLQLLEVSASVKEKYKIQSRQFSAAMLLQLLDLSSACDIHYKSARNQRLHVELTLLKMCSLHNPATHPDPFNKKADPATEKKPEAAPPVSQFTAPPVPSAPAPSSSPASPVQSAAPRKSSPDTSPRKSISITESLSAKPVAKTVNESTEILKPSSSSAFNEEQLEKAWISFSSVIKDQGK